MTGVSWAVYALILFGANVLGSVGGFGAGMISIPFLTQLFDAKSVIMASTMTCILNLLIAGRNRKWIQWKKLRTIVLWMCLGLPLGVWGLKILSVSNLKLILGIFMTLMGIYGLMQLSVPKMQKWKFPQPVLYLLLFLGGVMQGAISSGGSLILPYAQQELTDKRQFRATQALLWSLVSAIAVVQYLYAGTMTRQALEMAAVGAAPVLLGIYAGGFLCRKLNQRAFQYLINGLILAAGLMNCGAILL